MKAWMLSPSLIVMLSLVTSLALIGCTGNMDPWGHKVTSFGEKPLTAQVPSNSTNTTDLAPTSQPGDPLSEQVQNFLAKFPPDDRDRKAKQVDQPRPQPRPAPVASAATQPAVSPQMAHAVTPKADRPVTLENRTAISALPAPAAPIHNNDPPMNLAMQPVQAKSASKNAMDTHMEAEASPSPIGPPPPLPEPITHRPRVELIDVRASTPTTAPAPVATESAPPANRPIQQRASRGTDVTTMVTDLEAAVAAHPEHVDDVLKLRMLYLATGQDEKAIEPVSTNDPAQAELVSALFQVMNRSKSVIRQPASSPAPAIMAVDELRRLLAQQTPVMIPKIALVTSVNSFGDYEAVNPPQFAAGVGVEVFLYTEVANFRSEPTTDGRLRTQLSERVEIFDATGKIVWQQAVGTIEDKVLTPRRDFFIPLKITLPASTAPGQYVLKVAIEDKIGATTDQQRMTFMIGN